MTSCLIFVDDAFICHSVNDWNGSGVSFLCIRLITGNDRSVYFFSNMCEPLNEGWHCADGVSHSGVRVSLLVLNLPTYLLLTMDTLKARNDTGFIDDIQPN